MIKLTIYGRLRKFVGKSTFEIQAKSAKEAFSFLINNFQGIREHIKEQEYCVMAGDLRLTEDLLDMQTESDIKIIPIVHGTNLIVSGISVLLSPDPKPFNSQRQEDPQDPNYSFSGLLNNSKQGVPINIVYGEVLVGSTVVSSSVDSFQVVNEES